MSVIALLPAGTDWGTAPTAPEAARIPLALEILIEERQRVRGDDLVVSAPRSSVVSWKRAKKSGKSEKCP